MRKIDPELDLRKTAQYNTVVEKIRDWFLKKSGFAKMAGFGNDDNWGEGTTEQE